MKMLNQLLLVFGVIFVFFGCKEEVIETTPPPEIIRGIVQPVFGTGNYMYLDSVYVTPEGYDIKFTDIKFYFQGMQDNGVVFVHDALFDYRERGIELFSVAGVKDGIDSITVNLGVEPTLNHSDPSAFDNSSMLNIANANDMHWDWNPGYIFVKIEAKVDTISDGNALFDHNVIYHAGLDENMQTLEFNQFYWSPQVTEDVLPLFLDLEAFLLGPTPIDVKTEPSTHSAAGQEALTLKVMQNFAAAITPF